METSIAVRAIDERKRGHKEDRYQNPELEHQDLPQLNLRLLTKNLRRSAQTIVHGGFNACQHPGKEQVYKMEKQKPAHIYILCILIL